MMKTPRTTLTALVLLLTPFTIARAESFGGIGILGDSYSDEYQFYPPDRATARNWMEILAETRGLDFGGFSAQGRGEPRNQGYEYNWARIDATTEDMIATGQHSGLAAQVAAGKVGLVFIFIGGNDFIHALESPDPDGALVRVAPRVLVNFRTGVETILAASPGVKVVVGTIPDIRHLPEFDAPIRAGQLPRARADAYTAAISRYNAQIRALAANNPRVALLDLDVVTKLANLVSHDRTLIAGRTLDRTRASNDLDCFFLADARHPGTIGQGMIAKLFVDAINARFNAGVSPLDDGEILHVATTLRPVPGDQKLHAANTGELTAMRSPAATGPRADVPTSPNSATR